MGVQIVAVLIIMLYSRLKTCDKKSCVAEIPGWRLKLLRLLILEFRYMNSTMITTAKFLHKDYISKT